MLSLIINVVASYLKDIVNEILHDLTIYFVKKSFQILEDLLGRFYDATVNESDYSVEEEVFE
jgi:metal-dependent HD superfamily phosphatase/phosphodiesterase